MEEYTRHLWQGGAWFEELGFYYVGPIDGHDLDQRQVKAFLAAPADQPVEFAIVHALQRHRVDLDLQPGVLCRLDAFQHLLQTAPPGQRLELGRVQRVERNVDAAHTGIVELSGETGELAAVRGQGQLVQRTGFQVTAQAVNQMHDIAADQGFTTGQAQFAHAHIDECAAHAVQLIQSQDVFLGQKGHVFRHTIDTPEVAAVRHGNAQIGDCAPEWIDNRWDSARINKRIGCHIHPLRRITVQTVKHSDLQRFCQSFPRLRDGGPCKRLLQQ